MSIENPRVSINKWFSLLFIYLKGKSEWLSVCDWEGLINPFKKKRERRFGRGWCRESVGCWTNRISCFDSIVVLDPRLIKMYKLMNTEICLLSAITRHVRRLSNLCLNKMHFGGDYGDKWTCRRYRVPLPPPRRTHAATIIPTKTR